MLIAMATAERSKNNENTPPKNQATDSPAHAVHDAVADAAIGICGGFDSK